MTDTVDGVTVIFGYGQIGQLVAKTLAARGDPVRVAQRRRPADLPEGVQFVACDVLDTAAAREAVRGATQVLLAVAFAYESRLWAEVWPRTIHNVVEACAAEGARVVWIDNLYQLGPQDGPRHEGMALDGRTGKPAALVEATRVWMAARERVRFAALRCPDFYGPGVENSHLGRQAFGQLVQGKRAQMYAPLDTPHDFAFAPDIARAAVTLLDATDDAYGQAWHVPCASTRTPRELLRMGADALGVRLRLLAVPYRLLTIAGLLDPFAREMLDVGFTWNRPYTVDSSKWRRRFWDDPTPFEQGIPPTVAAFRAAMARA